jgi:drug/metabolite transporter (DMT)-like permease
MNTIYTKQIMRFDSVLCVLFWMTLAQSGFSLVLALPGGIPLPSQGLWPWILVVGLTGLTAHYSLTSALSWAPASVVAPMEFLRLPVLAALGMLVYGEPFDGMVFLGAGAIVLGNLVNLRGERARTAA